MFVHVHVARFSFSGVGERLHLACNAWSCILGTSWFMDDVMSASNAPSYIVTRKGHVLKTVPLVTISGAKSAIFDCLVCCRFVYVNPQHVQMLCVS